ncbi:MAG: collagen-binding protein [Acidobacteria bacterium 13_1_20CM_4_56_7]|nr:MAG: collagen-binding protein [Acidobacteria bacterium 13_1_20CM_4_56_7]
MGISVAERQAWRFLTVFVFLAMLLILTAEAWGQDNATITGTVADPSGGLVANVSISLRSLSTGQVRQVTSNTSGAYRFANVGVGRYTLEASMPGFEKFTKTDIVVNVAQTLEEDISLKVGSAQETVTVAADALQVQSQTNEISSLISGQQVSQLATNGRNVTALAALGTGKSNTLPSYGGVNALTTANSISFNGTRNTHNIYLVDGGELNDRGCGGCFSSLPSIDALSEFQTLDSNYGPDYGIGSGGTITMVIKSGTRDFHGALWEFNRNEDYQANNYFLNSARKARPKFRLNVPGGNFGGPLGKNTFFFVNEEWRRQIQGSTPAVVNTIAAANFPTLGAPLTYTVPSNGKVPIVPATSDPAKLALYAADGLTAGQPFPGNTIPANLIDQNAILELNAGTFPHPNLGTSQFISSIPQTTNVREDVVRIDHNINSKFQLMGHYLHDAVTQTVYPPLWGNSTYPTVGSAMLNPSWSSTVKLAQTYSPSLLNETSFLFSGNTIHLSPITGPGGSFVQPGGWTATSFFPLADNIGSRMPEVRLGAPYNTTWSSSYYPWKNSYFGYESRDDLSWTRGRHQFKFGFSWLHAVKNQQLQANTQGTAVFGAASFSLDSYVNFLLGDADSFTQLQFLAGKHWVNNNYGVYGNDNWRITTRLTLNLGLRYDGLPHAFERFNQFANFVPAQYDSSLPYPLNPDGTLNPASLTSFGGQSFYLNGIKEAGVGGFPVGNVHNSYNTIEPRVGFAYNLGSDGKTALRGGVGLFFERVQGNDVYNAALNPPFAYQPSATNIYLSNPNTSAVTGVTTAQTFPSTMTTLEYNYRPPGTAMFSLGIQRQLAQSVVASVQYVGSRGWDQSNDRSINTLPLTDIAHRQGVAGQIPDPNNPTKNLPPLNANLYRQFPGFSTITQEENESNFAYNSLQASLRMENRHGLTVQLAYTWSHEIDEVSNDLNAVSNPFDVAYDRGSGALDRRNIFNANYVYSLPFFVKSSSRALHTVLGGWQFSGITVLQSGTPIPIRYTGPDTLGLGGGTTNRMNQVAAVSHPHTVNAWFSTSSFANPVAPWKGGPNNGFGNARKDAVVGPGLFNFNLSLFKTIALTSRERGPAVELRFESFNTFNHTEFNGVDTGSNDANFGHVTSTYDPRVLQLGAKFSF